MPFLSSLDIESEAHAVYHAYERRWFKRWFDQAGRSDLVAGCNEDGEKTKHVFTRLILATDEAGKRVVDIPEVPPNMLTLLFAGHGKAFLYALSEPSRVLLDTATNSIIGLTILALRQDKQGKAYQEIVCVFPEETPLCNSVVTLASISQHQMCAGPRARLDRKIVMMEMVRPMVLDVERKAFEGSRTQATANKMREKGDGIYVNKGETALTEEEYLQGSTDARVLETDQLGSKRILYDQQAVGLGKVTRVGWEAAEKLNKIAMYLARFMPPFQGSAYPRDERISMLSFALSYHGICRSRPTDPAPSFSRENGSVSNSTLIGSGYKRIQNLNLQQFVTFTYTTLSALLLRQLYM
ncbi:hypothetical protein EDD16DRAFT_1723004 [Pisolithus croceorrhizus]|nr:hypothetical protein EDD16DRAFT_1723004 [Pisolithus croceorrhizus]KAI6134701.1 hypothetical protein EV401DRAFT_1882472 [Pisolithus croceorrhizus]KAI6160675.1 hypothetical protein EDD17DRAFT_1509973 [Pisolithus thermaeus]